MFRALGRPERYASQYTQQPCSVKRPGLILSRRISAYACQWSDICMKGAAWQLTRSSVWASPLIHLVPFSGFEAWCSCKNVSNLSASASKKPCACFRDPDLRLNRGAGNSLLRLPRGSFRGDVVQAWVMMTLHCLLLVPQYTT